MMIEEAKKNIDDIMQLEAHIDKLKKNIQKHYKAIAFMQIELRANKKLIESFKPEVGQ